MIYFAHAGHEHTETAVQTVAAQADSPNYGVYIIAAAGISLLLISAVLLIRSFKKKITD